MLPQLDYKTITTNFLTELTRASLGKPSSISYLRNKLPQTSLIKNEKNPIIQAIVIGGTNYITATQKALVDGTTEIIKYTTGELPLITDASILKTFLLKHYDQHASALGINFGFPMLPTTGPHGELDGKILSGTKEHLFEGLIGKTLGDFVRKTLKKNIPVAVANDTVCLALAGDGSENGSLIAGTGFNIGLKQQEDGQTNIINLEAGNFNKFPPTEILTLIDKASDMPGRQLFEKVISGKYLAEYFNKKADILGIEHNKITTSQELSLLSLETANAHANHLARAILDRSARLVACALAAIYQFYHSEKPLTFVGEGSLLWKGWEYTNNIQKQLQKFGVPDHAITIKQIKDSSIHGAFGLLTRNSI